jgi:hypothetical protein
MKIGIFGRGQLKNKKIIPELEEIGRMIAAKNRYYNGYYSH